MKDIRILLADNYELVRRGLRSILEQEEDIEIVGDCSSAEEALLQTETLSPNIILMDARMPGTNGIKAIHYLQQKKAPCNVILLTLYDDYVAEALEAGVKGYLLKDIKSEELVQAIRRVYQGELVIDERLISTYQAKKEHPKSLPTEDHSFDILIREAELIITPPFDVSQLLRFVYQIEEILHATIIQQIGSWDKGTAITITLRSATPLAVLLDRLEKMLEVENVREKSLAESIPSSLVNKIMARPETHPRKELLITLKQADTTRRFELAGLTG